MSEILTDALSRLDMMRYDHGQTWDLSKNDEAAISAVLDSHAALRAALDKAKAALKLAKDVADNKAGAYRDAFSACDEISEIAARALAELEGK